MAAVAAQRVTAVAGQRWSLREWLLAIQVAVCAVLLTASAVAVQAVRASAAAPIGFEPAHLTMVMADAGLFGYSRQQMLALDDQLLERVRNTPGVTRAALTTSLPLSIDHSSTGVNREEETSPRPGTGFEATYYYVSPGYFATVGSRLVAGRDFTDHDDRSGTSVAIVNQTFARRVVGTEHAVGRRFRGQGNRLVEIVGIVEDGKHRTLNETPQLALFRPRKQLNDTNIGILVRSDLPAEAIVPQVRAALRAIDPRLPVLYAAAADDVISLAFLPANAAGIALSVFGTLGVLLAISGLYSVAAFSVSGRTREIGLRVAIGARRSQVLRSVLGRVATCAVVGSLVGVGGGVAASQFLDSVLYHASPRDPLMLVSVVVVLSAIVLVATLGPARRALAVEPSIALREG